MLGCLHISPGKYWGFGTFGQLGVLDRHLAIGQHACLNEGPIKRLEKIRVIL